MWNAEPLTQFFPVNGAAYRGARAALHNTGWRVGVSENKSDATLLDWKSLIG